MKKNLFNFLGHLCLSLVVLTGALLLSTEAVADSEERFVQVRITRLRAQPQMWATGVADVKYGDSLSVVESSDGWFKVKTAQGRTGFIHSSAVTPRRIVLSGKGDVNLMVDSGDVVLAGKGFSKEVEEEYRRTVGGSGFSDVDAMERVNIREAELRQFIAAGKLG